MPLGHPSYIMGFCSFVAAVINFCSALHVSYEGRLLKLLAGTPQSDGKRCPYFMGDEMMLYLVIERFKNRDARAVYSRFRAKGRMLPEGLRYVVSWVETNYDRCFQVM